MITKEMTIGEAIKANPAIIPVLTDEGIDYCCGGSRPLESAATEKHLDLSSFVDLLNRQKETKKNSLEDALDLDKADLVDYIIRVHHGPEVRMINEIDENLQKLVNVHYAHHGAELTDIYQTFLQIKADMVPHFAKEEKRDFPEFLAGAPVDFTELKEEHEVVGELLETLEQKTDHYQPPQDGCLTYQRTFKLMNELQEDIHRHIFLENSVLFLK